MKKSRLIKKRVQKYIGVSPRVTPSGDDALSDLHISPKLKKNSQLFALYNSIMLNLMHRIAVQLDLKAHKARFFCLLFLHRGKND